MGWAGWFARLPCVSARRAAARPDQQPDERAQAELIAPPPETAPVIPRYKVGGDLAGSFWHVIGLCRFEPGELDPYLPDLRLPDDASFLTLPPP